MSCSSFQAEARASFGHQYVVYIPGPYPEVQNHLGTPIPALSPCPAPHQALAHDLPCAKHVHSKLICAVTREIMNDSNPPMVLPNGYVYSAHAIEAIANANGGRVVCPKTGAVFARDELRRAFIA